MIPRNSILLLLAAFLLQSGLVLAGTLREGSGTRKNLHRRGLSPFNPGKFRSVALVERLRAETCRTLVTVQIDQSIRPTSNDAKDFASYPGWKTFMAKARSVKDYTLVYTGEKSVSPFSSTIISSAVFPTAAAATCAKRCDSNPFCGAIEIFVERVPSFSPEPDRPNPSPAYQFVCRLHNKALGPADAKHTGRFYQSFYRTQTVVLFQNRKNFKKTFSAALDKTCTSDATCGAGFTCNTSLKKCKLAVGQPCSSAQDDSKCITGLCSSTGPFARTQCIARDQKTVSKDKHCLTSGDCDSQNCVSSTKLCGAKPLQAVCYDHTECETQFCLGTSFVNGRNVGVCAKSRKADGQSCQGDDDCKANYCDTSKGKCGRRATGDACTSANDCLINSCDPDKKVCGLSNGSSCNNNIDCASKKCALDLQKLIFTCQSSSTVPPNSVPNGEACSTAADCQSALCDTSLTPALCGKASGSRCDLKGECSTSSCDQTALGGAKCGKAIDSSCSTGSECSSGSCEALNNDSTKRCTPQKLANGQDCPNDEACLSGYCSGSKCASLDRENGLECTARQECISRNCNFAASPPVCAGASPCTRDLECPSGSFCDLTLWKCSVRGPALTRCSTNAECASLRCNTAVTPSVCAAPLLADGTTCSANSDCLNDYCRPNSDSTKTCATKNLAIGATCAGNDVCSSGRCNTAVTPSVCAAALKSDATACDDDSECTSGYCRRNLDLFKTCTAKNLAIGAACVGNDVCSSGRCNTAVTPSVCAAALKTDATACDDDSECTSGYCRPNSDSTKTCATKNLAIGATCAGNDVCSSGRCNTAVTPSVCAAALKSDATACDDDSECTSGYCRTNSDLTKTCVTRNRDDGAPCAGNDVCSSGRCNRAVTPPVCAAALLTDGTTCVADSDCVHNYCRTNSDSTKTCATKNLADGAACAGNDVCLSGRCDTASSPSICIASSSTCEANVPCSCAKDSDCDSARYCEGGNACVARKLAGEFCQADRFCFNSKCDDSFPPGRCGTPSGSPCLANSECSAGICDMGKCGKPDQALCSDAAECSSRSCTLATDLNRRCSPVKAELGQPCIGDSSCNSGYCRTNSDSTKTCATKNLAVGAPCAGNDVCSSGRCNTAVTPSVCAAALLTDGNICMADSDCVNDYCRTNSDSTKTCATKNRADGVACAGDDICSSGRCDEVRSICVPPLLDNGAWCSESGDCKSKQCGRSRSGPESGPLTCFPSSPCTFTSECSTASFCNAGYCSPLFPNDAECFFDSQCVSNLCTGNFCVTRLKENDEACQNGAECKSGYCPANNCADRLDTGEVCTIDDDCKSNSCIFDNARLRYSCS